MAVSSWSAGWKVPLGCLLIGLIAGSAWTYTRYYELPHQITAAMQQPRLEWQASAPVIRAGGWLNRPSGPDTVAAGQVLLVDVWAEWCDPCVRSTPGLVELYERFKDRVMFVGLTAGDQQTAEEYVTRFHVPWPVGYDLSDQTMQQMAGGGPLLFIVGRDGNVFWYDDRARLHHKTDRLWRRVEQELELALAEKE